ncbi:MAG: hypothetical protein K0U24_07735 [Gammaproteobacteria bacterium]|nr:hypothetical protein [Gammaproteobacteria bacterium]MCH9764092.1 hypothetical protein [Gammaproteobacteria bacterium]
MMESAETNHIVMTDKKLSVYISHNTPAVFAELNQALERWDYAHGAHVKIVCDVLDVSFSSHFRDILLSPRIADLSKSQVFFTIQLNQVSSQSLNDFFRRDAVKFPAHIRFVCQLGKNGADVWVEALVRALIDRRFSEGATFNLNQGGLSEKQALCLQRTLAFPAVANNLLVSYKNSMGVCEVFSSDMLKLEPQEDTSAIGAFLSGFDNLPRATSAPAAAGATEEGDGTGMLISLRLDTNGDSDDESECDSDDGPLSPPPPLPFQEDEEEPHAAPFLMQSIQYVSFFAEAQKAIYSIAEEAPDDISDEISEAITVGNTV